MMPFSGPYSGLMGLANWGAQQVPKLQNWWQQGVLPETPINIIYQNRIRQHDQKRDLENQMDEIYNRPEEPWGQNPHQRPVGDHMRTFMEFLPYMWDPRGE